MKKMIGYIDPKSGSRSIYGYYFQERSDACLKAILQIDNDEYIVRCVTSNKLLNIDNNIGNHGFEFIIPDKYKDGTKHAVKLKRIKTREVCFESVLIFKKDEVNCLSLVDSAKKTNEDKKTVEKIASYDKAHENKVKVSVIVPVYNNSQYLNECIDSILNQTLHEIEIIIVNDGSTDSKAIDILTHYSTIDQRVILINKKNTGYGDSMNIGISRAMGKYIGIVESDDCISQDFYQTLYDIANNYDLDIVKSDFIRFEDKNLLSRQRYYNKLCNDNSYYNHVINPMFDKNVFSFPMNTWSGIYKREFLKSNNILHNTSPGASFQDNGFWFLTFSYAQRVMFVNKAFYHNRRDNKDSSVYDTNKTYTMLGEYQYISNELRKNDDIRDKTKDIFSLYKYKAYMGSISRCADENKLELIKEIGKEFDKEIKNNTIDLSLFPKSSKDTVRLMIENPEKLYNIQSKQTRRYYLGEPILNQDKYKVSVIIPAYNAQETITRCVNSALNQTLNEIELIIINDGSQDKTYDICNSLKRKYGNIVLLTQLNSGSGIARNRGLGVAKGEYIAFLDSDDFYKDDDILETLVRKAEENGANICGGSFAHIRNGEIFTKFEGVYKNYIFNSEGFIEYKNYQFDYGYHRFIYKRSFLSDNNIAFPHYRRFQDPPFFVNAMIAAKQFYAIPKTTYYYVKQNKDNSLSDAKIYDILHGISDILLMSKNNKLSQLHKICVEHINNDFFKIITRSIITNRNIDILYVLIECNKNTDALLLKNEGYNIPENTPYILKPIRFLLNKN